MHHLPVIAATELMPSMTEMGPIPVRQLSRTALRKQTFRSAAVMSGSDPMRTLLAARLNALEAESSVEPVHHPAPLASRTRCKSPAWS